MLIATFLVSATLSVSPPLAVATQLNEYDGSMCRLLNISSDPPPAGAGYKSTIDGTGNMIQPPQNGTTVWFLCPATLTGNIQLNPYSVKDILFTIDLKTNPAGTVVTPSCQGEVDSLQGGRNIVNDVANGVGLDTRTLPASRIYFVCSAPAASQLYLRSYSLSLSYVLP